MIKLLGAGFIIPLLVGCAGANSFMMAHTDPLFLLKECQTSENVERCFITKMELRDRERVNIGLEEQTPIFKSAIAEKREKERIDRMKLEKEREELREFANIEEKLKARDRCLLISSDQLDSMVSKSMQAGNFEQFKKYNSDEFRAKAIQYCNSLAK